MALPYKRLCFVVLLLGCVLQAAQGEKWRAVAKMIRRCPGPPLALEMIKTNVILKNRGNNFRITCNSSFAKNVTFTKVKVNVYKSGGIRNLLFLTWAFDDVCTRIMKRHKFTDPIHGPGGLPRQCSFSKGIYPTIIDYDLHGDNIGMKVRGDLMVEMMTYDHNEMVFCMHAYGTVRKDTLN